jgi:hypothetical protein
MRAAAAIAQPILRIFASTDPTANLYEVFATSGRRQKAVRETRGFKLKRALKY